MPASLGSSSAQASCLLFPFAFCHFVAFSPTFISVVPLLSMLEAWAFTVSPLVLGVTMHLGLPPASSVAPAPSRCVCSALGCVRCCAGFAAGSPGCVGPLGRARVYFAPPPHMCCRVRAMNFGCQQPGTLFVECSGLVVSSASTHGDVLSRKTHTDGCFSQQRRSHSMSFTRPQRL
jgi:hypothetical protein